MTLPTIHLVRIYGEAEKQESGYNYFWLCTKGTHIGNGNWKSKCDMRLLVAAGLIMLSK